MLSLRICYPFSSTAMSELGGDLISVHRVCGFVLSVSLFLSIRSSKFSGRRVLCLGNSALRLANWFQVGLKCCHLSGHRSNLDPSACLPMFPSVSGNPVWLLGKPYSGFLKPSETKHEFKVLERRVTSFSENQNGKKYSHFSTSDSDFRRWACEGPKFQVPLEQYSSECIVLLAVRPWTLCYWFTKR